jgi:predicted DsbA family dithiol-disulfide isomerase
MRIDVWSDVVCPWCYLGKRRLETALEGFEHRDEVEVVWHAFELDPNAPASHPEPSTERLAKKYGRSVEEMEQSQAHLTGLAAEAGLEYHLDRTKQGNSFDAHRLVALGAAQGRQAPVLDRVLRAYFTEGEPISDRATLVRLAGEAGLDEAEAASVLADGTFADAVRADEQAAQQIGITGVPFFVVGGKYGISGAQPVELFAEALRRTWDETVAEPAGS